MPVEVVFELVKLSDLARAGWVGPIYARLIYEAGAETLDELSKESAGDFYRKLLAVNEEHAYTTASFSAKGMAKTIEQSQELPKANFNK